MVRVAVTKKNAIFVWVANTGEVVEKGHFQRAGELS
jgi:hypothetical protein